MRLADKPAVMLRRAALWASPLLLLITVFLVPVTNSKMKVLQGDMAVTNGGAHILAYLGDRKWIQADPSANKVIVESIPSNNGWFKRRVNIVRWKWMDFPNASGQEQATR
jgi:hypothetical protein